MLNPAALQMNRHALNASKKTRPMAIFTCFRYGEICSVVFLRDEWFCDLDSEPFGGEGHLRAECEWSVGYFKAYLFAGPFSCHITTVCTTYISAKMKPPPLNSRSYPTLLQQPAYSDAILGPGLYGRRLLVSAPGALIQPPSLLSQF